MERSFQVERVRTGTCNLERNNGALAQRKSRKDRTLQLEKLFNSIQMTTVDKPQKESVAVLNVDVKGIVGKKSRSQKTASAKPPSAAKKHASVISSFVQR
jgi:hypothetical protein